MTLAMPRSEAEKVFNQALESYPLECCGLLVGRHGERRTVVKAVPMKNTDDGSRRIRYSIDPLEYLKVEKEAEKDGLQVIGVYHSHPDVPARASAYDLENAFPWYSYFIVSVSDGEVREATSWVVDERSNQFVREEFMVEG